MITGVLARNDVMTHRRSSSELYREADDDDDDEGRRDDDDDSPSLSSYLIPIVRLKETLDL